MNIITIFVKTSLNGFNSKAFPRTIGCSKATI